jgi:hypothetical protein
MEEPMHDDTERWRRLTILDILCLFPPFALGAGAVRYLHEHASSSAGNANPWPTNASVFGMAFVALVLGSVLSGPVSLAVQFVFRRRRKRLSLGEWFWLEPVLLYSATWAISNVGTPSLSWLAIALVMQLLFSITAFAMFALFASCSFGMDDEVDFRWTDVLGCISCGSFGMMTLYLLAAEPVII